VRERKVKVIKFRTTETKEKVTLILLTFKRVKNPLKKLGGGGIEGNL